MSGSRCYFHLQGTGHWVGGKELCVPYCLGRIVTAHQGSILIVLESGWMLFGKGMKGLCRPNVSLFDVLLVTASFLETPVDSNLPPCLLLNVDILWGAGPRRERWRESSSVGGTPAEKPPKECGGPGPESSIAFCEESKILDASWEGLAFREDKF